MKKKEHFLRPIALFSILFILLAASALAGIDDIRVSNISSSSATISWTTTDSTDGCVRYGLTTSLGDTTCDTSADDWVHYVLLTGLTPDTTYYYEVKSDTVIDDNGGSKYTFHTAIIGQGTVSGWRETTS